MKLWTFALLACTGTATAAPGGEDAGSPPRFSDPRAASVVAALERQTADWNRGDLEAFCAIYADDAVFLSPSGVRRGRAEVLAGYKRKYTSRALMGTLSFEFLDVRVAEGGEAATVAARWLLKRPARDASGLTLLSLHLRNGSWTIVQDASM